MSQALSDSDVFRCDLESLASSLMRRSLGRDSGGMFVFFDNPITAYFSESEIALEPYRLLPEEKVLGVFCSNDKLSLPFRFLCLRDDILCFKSFPFEGSDLYEKVLNQLLVFRQKDFKEKRFSAFLVKSDSDLSVSFYDPKKFIPLSGFFPSDVSHCLAGIARILASSFGYSFQDKHLLTGDFARHTLTDTLEMVQGDCYPKHLGAKGYYFDGDSVKSRFVAFDNSHGDCFVEEFKTAKGAESWCRGELTADEVLEMESGINEIVLTRDSFTDYIIQHQNIPSLYNDTVVPNRLSFDENGECVMDFDFQDGCAFDLRSGLDDMARVGLSYPTLSEVMSSPEMLSQIEAFTGRRFSKGTRHEKIYDIALTFGIASPLVATCSFQRFSDAISCFTDRTKNPSQKAFTPEQRDKILLFDRCSGPADSHSKDLFRATFVALATIDLKCHYHVPQKWITDTMNECQGLFEGNFRDSLEKMGIIKHR